MRARIALSAVATVASLALAAPSVAAQQATAATPHATRVVAKYGFRTPHGPHQFPTFVAVADSAGTLVATAQIAGRREALPMMVTILDRDLVLQAETPDGRLLTLVLDRQAHGDFNRRVTGRWALGAEEGRLRGRARS